MIFFLRSYDNLPIYGGFNKSKSNFWRFCRTKNDKIEPHRQFSIRNCL